MAPIRIVSVSASVVFPCTINSRRRFLLAPAYPDSSRKRAIKRLCMCGTDNWPFKQSPNVFLGVIQAIGLTCGVCVLKNSWSEPEEHVCMCKNCELRM